MKGSVIAVIGAGLIGSSIARALRHSDHQAEILVYDPDPAVRRWLDDSASDADGPVAEYRESVAAAVTRADLVFVACPIAQTGVVFEELALHAPAHCLITDCASTKRSVIASASQALGPTIGRFVPGHPIAGAEHSGPGAGDARLFAGKTWLLCPCGPEQQRHADMLAQRLTGFGARVEQMDPERHDAMFAEFSHWPHALAFALCAAIAAGGHRDDAKRFSGAGLRDTTRIAASSAELWAGILIDNSAQVQDCARRFREQLDRLERTLAEGDQAGLEDVLRRASDWRRGVD